jgi:small subunit ribosomal protein S4
VATTTAGLKREGITGDNLMTILESRLDNVVFRLGFARTRKEARQTVPRPHHRERPPRVDIPSYQVKAGDVVAVAPKAKDLLPIKEALISSEHMARSGLA